MADCKYCTNYHLNSREARADDCCFGRNDCRKEYFSCNEGLKPKAAKPVSHSSASTKTKTADKDEEIYSEVTRRFDDMGRIYIPKDVRQKALGTSDVDGKMMKIFYKTDGTIILKPWILED